MLEKYDLNKIRSTLKPTSVLWYEYIYSPDRNFNYFDCEQGIQLNGNLIKRTLKHNRLQSFGALSVETSATEVLFWKPQNNRFFSGQFGREIRTLWARLWQPQWIGQRLLIRFAMALWTTGKSWRTSSVCSRRRIPSAWIPRNGPNRR